MGINYYPPHGLYIRLWQEDYFIAGDILDTITKNISTFYKRASEELIQECSIQAKQFEKMITFI
jgi:hypothetical protein